MSDVYSPPTSGNLQTIQEESVHLVRTFIHYYLEHIFIGYNLFSTFQELESLNPPESQLKDLRPESESARTGIAQIISTNSDAANVINQDIILVITFSFAIRKHQTLFYLA